MVGTSKWCGDPPHLLYRHKWVEFTHFLCHQLCPSNLYNFLLVSRLLTKFFNFLDVDPKTGFKVQVEVWASNASRIHSNVQ